MLTMVARFFSVILTKTGKNVPNNQQIYKMVIVYTKCQENRPNGHELNQPLPLQAPKKLPKLGFLV
jgi:hypothetical protein